MGDAVLGMVAGEMGAKSPRWVAVRNVSDPQIKAKGTLGDQADLAGQIYKGFGRWSSVCSGIVCRALIAAEKYAPNPGKLSKCGQAFPVYGQMQGGFHSLSYLL